MKKQKEKRKIIGRKYNKLGSIVWALKKLWGMDKQFVFFIFATIPVTVVLPLIQSYFAKVLLDHIGEGDPFEQLAVICMVFLTVISLLNLLKKYIDCQCWGRTYYPTQIIQNELGAISGYYTDFENTEKQDFRELCGYAMDDSSHGDCSAEYVWRDISKTLVDGFGILTLGSMLAFINPVLLVIVAVVSILSYFPTRWQDSYREKHKHLWEKEIRKVSYLQDLSENFPVAKDVKLYGMESWLENLMRHYQDYVFMWNKRCSLRGLWASMLAAAMTLIQDGAAYIFLIALLVNGQMGVGDFVFYFGIVGSIATFLTGIIGDIAKLSDRAEKIGYYRNVYDYPNSFNHGEGAPVPSSNVKIELKNVWYKYQGAEDYTIKGLNLIIEPGESIALVGLNGAGKTTLVKLICGMYAPTKGEILVNDKPIHAYNIEQYYSLISAVFQEVHMAAFTIFEFIATVDLQRSTAREDAIAALKKADLWDVIQSLPYGIDTHLMKSVYDDGVDLSGGQMQKLLLARAVYKNGPILILDEPTAALDPIAENNLYLQYRDLTKGKSSLYISHRFASTRFCDRIILLENGIITESGSHEELMKKNGQYAYMFGVQSKYYKEGEVHG